MAMKAEFTKEQARCRDLEGQIRDMSRQLNDKKKEVERYVKGWILIFMFFNDFQSFYTCFKVPRKSKKKSIIY